MAERCGLTAAYVSYLENGNRKGSLETYLKLAAALGLTPAQFFHADQAGGTDGHPKLSLEGLTSRETRILKQMAKTLRMNKRKQAP